MTDQNAHTGLDPRAPTACLSTAHPFVHVCAHRHKRENPARRTREAICSSWTVLPKVDEFSRPDLGACVPKCTSATQGAPQPCQQTAATRLRTANLLVLNSPLESCANPFSVVYAQRHSCGNLAPKLRGGLRNRSAATVQGCSVEARSLSRVCAQKLRTANLPGQFRKTIPH